MARAPRCQRVKSLRETALELGSADPGLEILGDLKLELILMNPGEVQAAGEGFLAKILGRIDDGEDVEFEGLSLFSDLDPGGDDLNAEVFGEDFGHRMQGQPFGKAAELLSEPTDLLSQLPELLIGFLELPVSLFLSDGETGDEFF